jgi:hypothetical protein
MVANVLAHFLLHRSECLSHCLLVIYDFLLAVLELGDDFDIVRHKELVNFGTQLMLQFFGQLILPNLFFLLASFHNQPREHF